MMHKISEINGYSFRFLQKSWPQAKAIANVVDEFADLMVEQRDDVFKRDNVSISNLLALASDYAEIALNEKKERWLTTGINCIICTNGREDFREIFRRLSLLERSSHEMGVRISDIIQDRLTFCAPATRQRLLEWLGRAPELNGIDRFEIRIVERNGALLYRPII